MAKSTRRTTKLVAMPRPASATPVPSQFTNPTEIDIAKRAFELYCERGCHAGHDVEDWLQAERQLRKTASSTAA
jgi:hypothetical protein